MIKRPVVAVYKVADFIVQPSDGPVQPGHTLFQQFLKSIGYQQLSVAFYLLPTTDTKSNRAHEPAVAFSSYRAQKMASAYYPGALVIQLRKAMFVRIGECPDNGVWFLSEQQQDTYQECQDRQTKQD